MKYLALGDSSTIGELVNYSDNFPSQLVAVLNKKEVPAIFGLSTINNFVKEKIGDQEIVLPKVSLKLEKEKIYGACSSFGFGGTNAHAVLSSHKNSFEEKNYKVVLAKGKIAGADIEDTEILEFQKQIDSYNKDGKGISIRVGEKIYGGITTITKVGLNRKSDFYLSSKTTPLIFLQHKGPQHQQMSGIAKSPFSEHPEVISFVEEVREKVREEGRLRGIYSKEIIDSKLKMLAAYGTTSSEFNVNAVHLYCVGSLELVSVGDNLFEISADRIYTYPQIPDKEDKPMLGATFRTDRNQSGIPQTRLGIYPANYTC